MDGGKRTVADEKGMNRNGLYNTGNPVSHGCHERGSEDEKMPSPCYTGMKSHVCKATLASGTRQGLMEAYTPEWHGSGGHLGTQCDDEMDRLLMTGGNLNNVPISSDLFLWLHIL